MAVTILSQSLGLGEGGARPAAIGFETADDPGKSEVSALLFVSDAGDHDMRTALAGEGVEVEWVQDLQACRAMVEHGRRRFDVVVLDTQASAVFENDAESRIVNELRERLAVLALVDSREEGAYALERGVHGFSVRCPGSTLPLIDAAYGAIVVFRLRRALHSLHEQLLHAGRLSSLGQLTAGVAHEVNTPVASVYANLTALRDRISAMEARERDPAVTVQLRELCEILDESLSSVSHIRSIMRDLRSFARVDMSGSGAADLSQVIEDACKLAGSTVRHRARLRKELAPVPKVAGDHNRLVQVFTNLLTNAAQAITGPAEDNEICVATRQESGRVIAVVEDTGCGIPEDIRGRIFEPFFTTKPAPEGTGLGLSLSADIVRSLGGDIAFEPREERGTRFRVSLMPMSPMPMSPSIDDCPASSVSVATQIRARRAAMRQRARVLLIDDEPSLLRALRRILSAHHDVTMAMSGEQALDILRTDSAFDAIICDFSLPDLDGMDIYEAIAKTDRELAERMVFFTGGAVSHRGQAFIDSVSNTVLEKPVPPEILLGAIEQLGKRPG